MVLSSVGAFAQYSAGDITIQPKVGLNVSSVTDDEAGYIAGFVGGIEGEYHVSPMVGISAVFSILCKEPQLRTQKVTQNWR